MSKKEVNYVLESLKFKTSIYRDKHKRNLSFNDDEYYSYILLNYIENLQQENNQLKQENQMLKLTIEKLTYTPYEYGIRGN